MVSERSLMSRAAPAGWYRATGMRSEHSSRWRWPLARSSPAAILDGEIARPGADGGPMFYELMRRRGPFCFYAFDLLWLDGCDLRDLALSGRKALLRKLLPRRKERSVLYVEHVANGMDLFRVICERDMEGIVAKQASARYTPEATTWVKIKNRQYSQAVGREDFFDCAKARV